MIWHYLGSIWNSAAQPLEQFLEIQKKSTKPKLLTLRKISSSQLELLTAYVTIVNNYRYTPHKQQTNY